MVKIECGVSYKNVFKIHFNSSNRISKTKLSPLLTLIVLGADQHNTDVEIFLILFENNNILCVVLYWSLAEPTDCKYRYPLDRMPLHTPLGLIVQRLRVICTDPLGWRFREIPSKKGSLNGFTKYLLTIIRVTHVKF